MNRIANWGSIALLIAPIGFSEAVITAQDYAVDSDVVLESVVKEVKSIPADTANVVGDSVKYVADETVTAANGVKAVFTGASPHEKAQKSGALAVANAWGNSGILFRDYKVSKEIGDVLLTGTDVGADPSIDVSGFFKSIEFPENTSAYYRPKHNQLLVRQTMDNLLAIETVLAKYQNGRRELLGHQVEIEAKFVEVNQSTLNDLGFRWGFGSKDGGAANILGDLVLPGNQDILAGGLRPASSALNSGVEPATMAISKAAGSLRWDLYISALEQSDDADVLSAPRVVTRDGSKALIKVGEQQMIPKAFDVNNQDVSPWVEHTDWDSELTGVELEVTPELRKEGGLIDLKIIPRVKELVGYDTYEVLPAYGGGKTYRTEVPALSIENPVTGTLPYFRIREMETQVTVADGSTVGMGGLIYDRLETYKDKVPLLGSIPYLGRLFRSEGERSVKRNLMVFVTATQVDVDGRKSSKINLKR